MQEDDRWDRFFADLEQQAEGLTLDRRDAEVAEQRIAEYARVDLASRLFGGVGARLQIVVAGVGPLDGLLRRMGDGWGLLRSDQHDWVVRVAAVTSVRGLPDGGLGEQSRPLTARLGLGSALREVARGRAEVVLHRTDGSRLRGVLARVGADFVEVRRPERGDLDLLPFSALAAVQERS